MNKRVKQVSNGYRASSSKRVIWSKQERNKRVSNRKNEREGDLEKKW